MIFNFNKKATPFKEGQDVGDSTLAEMLSNTIAMTAGTPDGKPMTMKRTMKLAKYMSELNENGTIKGEEEDAKELERFIEDSAFAIFVKAQLFEIVDDARLEAKKAKEKKEKN